MAKLRMVFLVGVAALTIAACGGPKTDARNMADRFPAELSLTVTDEETAEETAVVWWELSEDRIDLSIETQANYGYSTITYEGATDALEDVLAFITIVAHANESAADVAQQDTMLDWQLQGARFEAERFGRDRFDIAILSGGLLAFYQNEATVFEVRIVPEDVAMTISEEAYTLIFEIILQVADAS